MSSHVLSLFFTLCKQNEKQVLGSTREHIWLMHIKLGFRAINELTQVFCKLNYMQKTKKKREKHVASG